jgi:cation diffusion facilitator family transporter
VKRQPGVSLGYLEGIISVILNTALFGVKIWVGTRSGSVAMIADAWHTLSDTLTSLVVIAGFWIVARKPDAKHPLGHGRAEAIASVVIAVLLAVVGGNFLLESVNRLRAHASASFSAIGLVVFLSSAVLKEALAQFSMWAGRKIKAQSLIADGWHHRSDAIASALIVVGMLVAEAGGPKLWWIDGVMGIAVALLILYAAVDIFRASASFLMGEAHDRTLEESVRAVVVQTCPVATDVHHFHVHSYGGHNEMTLHLRLPQATTLEECHRVASVVEQTIREKLGYEATVHVEPAGGNGAPS